MDDAPVVSWLAGAAFQRPAVPSRLAGRVRFLFVAWTIRMRMRREPLPHKSYDGERTAEPLEPVSPKVVTIRQRSPEILTPSG